MDYPKSLAWVGLLLGKFTNGTQDGSVKPSADPAEWANAVTDEILAVVRAAGMEPNEADTTQLRDAIGVMIAANVRPNAMPVIARAAAYTALESDRTKVIEATGVWSLGFAAAATLGDGWWCAARNSGTGIITLDPDGAELIDGALAVALPAGASCLVVCDGFGLRTIGLGGSARAPGEVFWTRASTPPAGSMKANGAAVAREAYGPLDTAIYVGDAANATAVDGYRCSNPDSPATTRDPAGDYIVLPNLVNRVPIGAGGNYALGSVGGEAAHALTIQEMPAHNHVEGYDSAPEGGGKYGQSPVHTARRPQSDGATGAGNLYTSTSGEGAAHNNLPPFAALLPCIQY